MEVDLTASGKFVEEHVEHLIYAFIMFVVVILLYCTCGVISGVIATIAAIAAPVFMYFITHGIGDGVNTVHGTQSWNESKDSSQSPSGSEALTEMEMEILDGEALRSRILATGLDWNTQLNSELIGLPVAEHTTALEAAQRDPMFDIRNLYDRSTGDSDSRLSERQKFTGQQAKQAMENRARFNVNSIRALYEDELRANENRDWWDNEMDFLDQYM